MDGDQTKSRVRTQAFGTRTTFRKPWGRAFTNARLLLLRVLRPERDARSLRSLHFARWFNVSGKTLQSLTRLRRVSEVARDQDLFLSDFSGDGEFYLEGFNRVIRVALDIAWRDATDWKNQMALGEYLTFIKKYRLPAVADAYVQSYGASASVHDVRASLRVSDALDQFVYATDALSESDRFVEAYKQLCLELDPLLATSDTRALGKHDWSASALPAPKLERDDIQGNILESYRRRDLGEVRHLFVRFRDAAAGRRVLEVLRNEVTSAAAQQNGSCLQALNVGLSYAGLQALDLSEAQLASFPPAFRAGMRARAVLLEDHPAGFGKTWSEQAPVHMWLLLHAEGEARLRKEHTRLWDLIASDVILCGEPLTGSAPKDPDSGKRVEHFGFRDDISRTSILGSLTRPRAGDGKLTAAGNWEPLATGELLLGHIDEAGEIAAADCQLGFNGTFAVFRQLSQDVPAFRRYVRAQADKFARKPEWIAARIVGRTPAGDPLNPLDAPGGNRNDFHFGDDPDGRVCPLGAHIRRANPRDAHSFVGASARHRIVRRGSPYGERLAGSWHDEPADHKERGLFFIALNADLERQFEFLQRLYMNDGAAAQQASDADPLTGNPRGGVRNLVIPGDASEPRDTLVCAKLPSFVECLGGEYFLLPSLTTLRILASSGGAAKPVRPRTPSQSIYEQPVAVQAKSNGEAT
jgi:Dyp-type peroxidase family